MVTPGGSANTNQSCAPFANHPIGKNQELDFIKKKMKNLSEKNGMWKGDKVGYTALHDWIKRRLPKPKYCQCCEKNKAYDLANISQEYKRDLLDWEWLCRKCHMRKDKRDQHLGEYIKKHGHTENFKRWMSKYNIERGIIPPSALGIKRTSLTKIKMAQARRRWWDKYYKGEVTSKRYKNYWNKDYTRGKPKKHD